jgi:acyl carrier protein
MIEDSIRRYISDELSAGRVNGELADDYPLLDSAVLDSLGMFNLVGYLEDTFGVEVQDEEIVPDNFATIGDIARLVRSKDS